MVFNSLFATWISLDKAIENKNTSPGYYDKLIELLKSKGAIEEVTLEELIKNKDIEAAIKKLAQTPSRAGELSIINLVLESENDELVKSVFSIAHELTNDDGTFYQKLLTQKKFNLIKELLESTNEIKAWSNDHFGLLLMFLLGERPEVAKRAIEKGLDLYTKTEDENRSYIANSLIFIGSDRSGYNWIFEKAEKGMNTPKAFKRLLDLGWDVHKPLSFGQDTLAMVKDFAWLFKERNAMDEYKELVELIEQVY